MTIAAVGAAAIGAWLEAALVVVLFSVGELLEGRAVDRARRELAGLVSLTPETARVRRRQGDGAFALVEEVEVPVAEVVVGDLVVVRPGERIPVDGVVREGASAVDQAPITGESTPVDKAVGDAVFAGTLNGQGLLVVEATTAPGDTTLDRIGKLVAEAQARKSPSERWVDSFARWYTPAVVVAAALVAVVPPLFGVAFSTSFYSALALLILACPCALVISTPGRDRLGARSRLGGRRARQGRRPSRAGGGDPRGRVRQDRHAHRGPAERGRGRAAGRRRGASCWRSPHRSSRARSIRSHARSCAPRRARPGDAPGRGLRGAHRARRPRARRRRGS